MFLAAYHRTLSSLISILCWEVVLFAEINSLGLVRSILDNCKTVFCGNKSGIENQSHFLETWCRRATKTQREQCRIIHSASNSQKPLAVSCARPGRQGRCVASRACGTLCGHNNIRSVCSPTRFPLVTLACIRSAVPFLLSVSVVGHLDHLANDSANLL